MRKYYVLGAVLLGALLVVLEVGALRSQYQKGYRVQNQVDSAAASLVVAQADNREQLGEVYEKMEAIAASDVYQRDCLNADGLRELNAFIKKR
ncbi:hypothetical protein QDY71_10230 [Kingella negevensis]|uniref:Uncharacterized protein n=1 Tax=Kingella negevensis TaxID=1522312 RepID=A0A238TDT2_9NEIS|nr:hypothetical protein [Kingella negevensis]MDK4680836.1 hypothetical protein [Kingella negevensis]MDK4681441.1 hypothetical protein [Kingella negevensis]MDK4684276.1 hypothetical protein [Kingella negevensis]MDK4691827.1 hypothetical protein [Kingella negevensis]MDK4693019.1 hypothetical protein [Kingella negevensis]